MKLNNILLLSSLSLFSSTAFAGNTAEVKIGMFKCGPDSSMRCPHLWFKTGHEDGFTSVDTLTWTYDYGSETKSSDALIVWKRIDSYWYAEKTDSGAKFPSGSFFQVKQVCMTGPVCWEPGNEGYAQDGSSDGTPSSWVTYERVSPSLPILPPPLDPTLPPTFP